MRLDLAGPARRSIAFMVDTLVVSLLLLAVAAALTMAFGPAIRFTASPGQPLSASFHDRLVLVGVVSSIILSATYFAVSWSRFRATPGQYMLGLRVSNRSSGGQLSVARALIRWAALGAPLWILSSLIAGLGGFVAMLAELPNSFAKRQLGIGPGQAERGLRGVVFYALDQVDILLGAWLVLAFVAPVRVSWVLFSILLVIVVHQLLTTVTFRLGMRASSR